ncbi:MAG TPA: hypothetical protein VM715_23435 [Candidatus Acidoferrum sp.]|nr:hypothetical protein [Candidatus Acidoferrum sp.]
MPSRRTAEFCGFAAVEAPKVWKLGLPNIVAYLARIGQRPAYQMAMQKSDPGMALLLT